MNLIITVLNGGKMKIQTLNKQIENIHKQIRNLQIKKSSFSQAERKKRARNLIILGANFEILGYEKEDTRVVLGFLKENIEKIKQNRDYYKSIGEQVLEERRKKEVILSSTRQITSTELKELLVLSKEFDISTYIQTEFKKTLWEKLTLEEFMKLKKHFNGK